MNQSKSIAGIVMGLWILGLTAGARADITLPHVLAEHMVIQRDKPVHVWGSASPAEKVKVEFRGHQAETAADDLGRWSVLLPADGAGGPFELTITGNNRLAFKDILVGDVWVAAGQSNMEFPMGFVFPWKVGVLNYKTEIPAANYPNMRLFHVHMQHADFPQTDTEADTWTATTPLSVATFSAVAYYFGRELLLQEKVPIGLMEADVGATPIESWMSMDSLTQDAAFMPVFSEWARVSHANALNQLKADKKRREYERAYAVGEHPDPLVVRRSYIFDAPAQLFNAMIAPLTPTAIRGIIWFQGEGNAGGATVPIYQKLSETMIADWRKRWGVGDVPFIITQISNLQVKNQTPEVRDAQRRVLNTVPNTGLAVTIDVGEEHEYHPSNKIPVGHRLALWARVLAYGEKLEDSGPLYRQSTIAGGRMRVEFDHTTGGLVAKGGSLKGFEVAGSDGRFRPATAEIDGNAVMVRAADVAAPQQVRYAWAAYPDCNLYNGAELPASPFTSMQ